MKILILTQKVDKDDSYFGFFHSWLTFFAKECAQVTVITLERHAYDLPEHVRVLSLGKEEGKSRFTYLLRFWKYAWVTRHDYDVVFCHMSPLYVIAGFPIWNVLHKKISLWYIHRNVDLKLRISEKLADVIFTASPESFRIKSKKVKYVRQAVNVSQFERPADFVAPHDDVFRIVSVGRLTYIKNLDVLIRAAAILHEEGIPIEVKLVGAAVTEEDNACEASLRTLTDELKAHDYILFTGSIPFRDICTAYWNSTASVNLCPTGGMDKAVLESLASGTPALLSNEAFRPVLAPYQDALMFPERNIEELVRLLRDFHARTDVSQMASSLQDRIRNEFSLASLIHSVVETLQSESS